CWIITTTGSPPIQSPAATPLASSSVAHVSTRMPRCLSGSLSRAASTVFWCVSGTLSTQPSGSRRAPPRSLAKRSFSVSTISDAGMDSGISISLVQEGKRAGDVREGHRRGGVQVRAIEGRDAVDAQQAQADADLFLE